MLFRSRSIILLATSARRLHALNVSKKCPQGVPSQRPLKIANRYPRRAPHVVLRHRPAPARPRDHNLWPRRPARQTGPRPEHAARTPAVLRGVSRAPRGRRRIQRRLVLARGLPRRAGGRARARARQTGCTGHLDRSGRHERVSQRDRHHHVTYRQGPATRSPLRCVAT